MDTNSENTFPTQNGTKPKINKYYICCIYFGEKLKFWAKNQNFGRKIESLVKDRNFGKKSKFWRKIEMLAKNRKFGENRNFGEKSKLWPKIEILAKNDSLENHFDYRRFFCTNFDFSKKIRIFSP